jgi:hypothetical protein
MPTSPSSQAAIAEGPVTDAWSLELDALLDSYGDKLKAIEQRKQQVETDKRLFLEGFAALRKLVIRPLFEAAGAALERRGHAYSITEQEYAVEAAGKTTDSSIAFQMMPGPSGEAAPLSADRRASLSFHTRHYTKSISIGGRIETSAADGSAGPRGDYQLAQIDKELVQRELLTLFAAMVGR